MGTAIEVTDDSFEADVLQAETPTLVDFWAEWCGPCKMVAPVVEEIAASHQDKLRVAKMDVDNNRLTPSQYGIFSIPTLILFKNGEEAARIVGYRAKEALEEELLPHIT